MPEHKCENGACTCGSNDRFCSTKCREEARDGQPEQKPELSTASIEPAPCDCGHLDCDRTRPEPQV